MTTETHELAQLDAANEAARTGNPDALVGLLVDRLELGPIPHEYAIRMADTMRYLVRDTNLVKAFYGTLGLDVETYMGFSHFKSITRETLTEVRHRELMQIFAAAPNCRDWVYLLDADDNEAIGATELAGRLAESIENPDLAFPVHFLRGRIAFALGRIQQAICNLQVAIKLVPSFGRSYLLIGRALARDGQGLLAAENFDVALCLPTHNWLGYAVSAPGPHSFGQYRGWAIVYADGRFSATSPNIRINQAKLTAWKLLQKLGMPRKEVEPSAVHAYSINETKRLVDAMQTTI